MPLTVSISISQNSGVPSSFTITDTSTGSDATITTRRIYLFKADNTNLVPDGTTTAYVDWPIAEGPITLDVLDRDLALMIVVQWLDNTTVVYDYTNYYVFLAYTNTFLFGLSTSQSAQMLNPNILTATDFFKNKATLWGLVKDAQNAIDYGQDTVKSQYALDLAFSITSQSDKYF